MTARLAPIEVEVEHLQRRLIHMSKARRDPLLDRLLAPFGVLVGMGPHGPAVHSKRYRRQQAKRLEAWRTEQAACQMRAVKKTAAR